MVYTALVWHRDCATQRVVAMDRENETWYAWWGVVGVDVPSRFPFAGSVDVPRWASTLSASTDLGSWREASPLPPSLPTTTDAWLDETDVETRALGPTFASTIGWLRAVLDVGDGRRWRLRPLASEAYVRLTPTTIAALALPSVVAAFPTVSARGRAVLDGWFAMPCRDAAAIEARRAEVSALRVGAYAPLVELLRAAGEGGAASPSRLGLPQLLRTLQQLAGGAAVAKHCATHALDLASARHLRLALRHTAACRRSLAREVVLDGGSWRPGEGSALAACVAARDAARARVELGVVDEWRRRGARRKGEAYVRLHGRVALLLPKHGPLPTDGVVLGTTRSALRWEPPGLVAAAAAWRAADSDVDAALEAALERAAGQLRGCADALRLLGEALATLDALLALAVGALRHDLVAPRVGEGLALRGLRHVLVPDCVPNDLALERGASLGVTGGNTDGKSTLLRSVATAAVLHQVGSFVPARHAVLPIFGQIAYRCGTNDSLRLGLSSFVAQMREVASMLRGAGPDSLLCFDELGAATSTREGSALARAVIEHLVDATVLVTTHDRAVVNACRHCVAVDAAHRLRPGVASSDAIATARRLGLCSPLLTSDYLRGAAV